MFLLKIKNKIVLLLISSFLFFVKNVDAEHIQKYYSELNTQKIAISDMFSFGEIGVSQNIYQVNRLKKINISIFIGSDDNQGLINQFKKEAILKLLQARCYPGIYACEMNLITRSSLVKDNFSIQLFAANVTNGYKIKKYFEQSFLNSDVVIYLGHSRNGGGPDFSPAKYYNGTSRVNYNYYQKKKTGVQSLKRLLKIVNHPKLLALLSCNSKQHFSNLFKGSTQVDTLLTGELIANSNMDKVLFSLINHLLSKSSISLNESILKTIDEKSLLFLNP